MTGPFPRTLNCQPEIRARDLMPGMKRLEENMYIDIDRFEGEAMEPDAAFVCEGLGCGNIVRAGQPCYDNRLCEECGEKTEGAEFMYAEPKEW